MGFLNELKSRKSLKLVKPSKEICESYLEKSKRSMKSAKLLQRNNLYENSISMSYYTIYNSVTALLRRVGVKCENHFGSILMLKVLFNRRDLFKEASSAKSRRINNQYYISSGNSLQETAENMVKKAEEFSIQIRMLIDNLTEEEIREIRKKFTTLLEQ